MAVLTLQFHFASFWFFISRRSHCAFFKFLAAARKIFANAIAYTLRNNKNKIQRQRQKFKCSSRTNPNESKKGWL